MQPDESVSDRANHKAKESDSFTSLARDPGRPIVLATVDFQIEKKKKHKRWLLGAGDYREPSPL